MLKIVWRNPTPAQKPASSIRRVTRTESTAVYMVVNGETSGEFELIQGGAARNKKAVKWEEARSCICSPSSAAISVRPGEMEGFAVKDTQIGNEVVDEAKPHRPAKRDDIDAFEGLMHRYSSLVLRAAFQITRSREGAEKIARETFLKAFQHLDSSEEGTRISRWLTRIAVNAALIRVRDLRFARTVLISEKPGADTFGSQQIANWRPNPEHLSSRGELSDSLRRGLRIIAEFLQKCSLVTRCRRILHHRICRHIGRQRDQSARCGCCGHVYNRESA